MLLWLYLTYLYLYLYLQLHLYLYLSLCQEIHSTVHWASNQRRIVCPKQVNEPVRTSIIDRSANTHKYRTAITRKKGNLRHAEGALSIVP